MDQIVLFVTLGFAVGAVYAVVASSLVAVHAATGVLNFAQGSIALWGVWVAAELGTTGTLVLPVGSIAVSDGPTSAAVAVAVGTLSSAVIALLTHLLVLRPLRSAPVLSQVVASVGVMLVIVSLVPLRFDVTGSVAPPILPAGTVEILGAAVAVSDLILVGLAVAIALLLAGWFRFTRWGMATRASAQDETAVMLTGYSPDRLAAVVWVATGAATGLVAIVASPTVGLDPLSYTFYVLPGLAAALLARLRSVLGACAAGLGIGIFQSLLLMMSTYDFWPTWAQAGFGETVPFLIVVIALFAFGKAMPARGGVVAMRMPTVRPPSMKPLPTLVLIGVAVAAVLLTDGSWRFGVVTSIIMSLIALSLVVLTGYLGQISLAAMAFAGTGGFVLSRVTTEYGIAFPWSLIGPALAATLLGVVVAVPALRIRGAHLAVVTLAAALAIESFVFGNPAFTPFEGNHIADPSLFGIDLAVRSGTDLTTVSFALMVLTVVAVLTWVTARLLAGRTGRAFLAVRSNERAAASAGIDVAATKLLGFALSAFLAGVGGCLIGYSRSQLSVESFNVLVGLTLLCTVYVAGITSIAGAVLAGLIAPLGVLAVILEGTLGVGEYYSLIAALALVITAVLNPVGITGSVREASTHLAHRRSSRADA
ncbi:branched-chain amino acid transport system permease protein [Mumia flava]|uniref:Branched-chain amino acid transport system permease protein n=1 Tax=Mumia flava TaxID=1348852 RepID=A0A2M9BIL3_9ACTN|nr:ABC transporter permease [Mumia flava]PJJ57798.1 branched-chain amino acid transport system permease protein [Mumia flava]